MFPQFANSETVESCRMICNYFVKQLHHSLAGAESDVDKQVSYNPKLTIG